MSVRMIRNKRGGGFREQLAALKQGPGYSPPFASHMSGSGWFDSLNPKKLFDKAIPYLYPPHLLKSLGMDTSGVGGGRKRRRVKSRYKGARRHAPYKRRRQRGGNFVDWITGKMPSVKLKKPHPDGTLTSDGVFHPA